jgi:acyl-CoA thioesterase I
MTDSDGPLILFQGDSITDAARNREVFDDLGNGYAAMAAAWYQSLFPERMARFINRGIGGDTATGLRARWQEDCLDLRPDLVSILVGINDAAEAFRGTSSDTLADFEAAYRDILTRTSTMGAELLLMEPFVLPCLEDRPLWRKDLDPRIHIVRDMAREFNAAYIPLDGLFAQSAARREPAFWAPDGVHPSPPGQALIAQAWLDAAQDLF